MGYAASKETINRVNNELLVVSGNCQRLEEFIDAGNTDEWPPLLRVSMEAQLAAMREYSAALRDRLDIMRKYVNE